MIKANSHGFFLSCAVSQRVVWAESSQHSKLILKNFENPGCLTGGRKGFRQEETEATEWMLRCLGGDDLVFSLGEQDEGERAAVTWVCSRSERRHSVRVRTGRAGEPTRR
jgi:hypothetical protein